jgi:acetyl esterase/lipase
MSRHLFLALTVPFTLAGCSLLTPLNIGLNDNGYALQSGVAYGEDPRQRLDVYKPVPQLDSSPIVVFFYGGSWKGGERGDYRFVANALTSRGYIAVLPDYRVYPEHLFPDFVEDGAEAVRWALEHAAELGGDLKRVYLMGHSAGAHIVAMLTLDEHFLMNAGVPNGSLAGTIAIAGPYAFYPSKTANIAPIFAELTDEDLARPVAFVDGSEAPLLLLHGEEDTTVLPANTIELADAVRNAGGSVTQSFYPGIGHFKILLTLSGRLPNYAPVLSDVAAFIDGTADLYSARDLVD